ncbi:Acetyl-CoA acetyltransferase [Pseudomonas aeruginosa]|nr:Acetyl-CoA acetyltransferase [Pseudomonas aeruginosa]
MQDVVIVAATRTAVGSFQGSLAGIPAPELGAAVIRRLLEQTGLDAGQVDEVILGQVLTAGSGQNPARQAAIKAGLPVGVPAMTLNKVCGSGLKALHLGAQVQGLEAGAADLVQGHGRHADRQAGLDRRLARRVLPGPGGEHLAEDDFVDLAGIETGLFEQAADYRGAQLGGGNAGQRALEAADGGTGSGDDDDVLHGWFSWIRPWPGRIAAGGRRRCDSLLSYALWKGRSARPAPCVEAPAARAAIQKLISGTCSGTISLPAVFATISSTLTPGARSRRMKAPSSISR